MLLQAAHPAVKDGSVSVILLAGGIGKRMGVSQPARSVRQLLPAGNACWQWRGLTHVMTALQASIPKQYLELLGQPIAVYSLLTFMAMPEVGEVVIVCDPSYR